MALFRLDGKKALITGGATGIGYGIATAFVLAGARVILVGRREQLLKESCAKLGAQASYEVFDIDQQNGIPDFVRRLEAAVGGIDILVNNAGRHAKKPVFDISDQEFLSILQTNLLSAFSLSRECARHMVERGGGAIILISSMTAGVAMNQVVGYSTAKTALLGMMRTLSVEWAADNIRVNAIAPGWIESDMLKTALHSDPERKRKILGRIPYGRFGQPADIGNAAVFLASDAANYITNVLLPVDGGALQAL